MGGHFTLGTCFGRSKLARFEMTRDIFVHLLVSSGVSILAKKKLQLMFPLKAQF